jgi:hypothetical protein
MLFLPGSSLYSGVAIIVLGAHALFILWVVFGAFVARSRPILLWLHIGSLIWSLLVEILYWPCPLTVLENWLEQRAGVEPYSGGYLLHYLDKVVYPDIPAVALTISAVIVGAANLAYYVRLFWIMRRRAKLLPAQI